MSAQPDTSILNSDVIAKYKLAGEITARVFAQVKALAVPGAMIYDICVKGDELLAEELSQIYNNKKTSKIPKGIAFPTSVSPNNIAAHNSPYAAADPANVALVGGDVAKIALGIQIDGYASIMAETVVVGVEVATGRAADVVLAAWNASEAALRSIKVGRRNWDVTRVVDQVAEAYGCSGLEGMLTHNQDQNVLTGFKEVIINPSDEQKAEVDTMTFEEGEVYGLDVLVSTGTGAVNPAEVRTTIFKLTGNTYSLKLKQSHGVLAEFKKKGALLFPFSIRNLDDPTKGKTGLHECSEHKIMQAYDVMREKKGELIAQFYTTIGVTKTGLVRLTSPEFDASKFQSEKKIEDQVLLDLLAEPYLKVTKKKNNKKKA
ncbi:hypothetical protein BABINDRAFT_160118 [Babjeviella inositovora NRRL Y-12698]|uniref:Peptidase M24 domain-containing protein n=1 Tax=Babjeviella inositovora NRRL Y-12698 TaxID=984486 RepID=A0A1E3QW35_9ASCO|nr:uncharacterized protein BABINDRAFT_160118 [Babjeviella inositovora NRRL Y-12698]ODQ81886.1 hypothetical protein BABINDRAFT_160118 [Babjeviella inositovora NRRL Y-12698]